MDLNSVLERIRPSEEERKRLEGVVQKLLRKTREVCEREGMGEPMLVGSAARGTWLREERDIDIFILFPEDLSRERLEELGLRIGREVAEGRGRERYAEHPYVSFEFEGFEVDLVPCYKIQDPRRIKSAVDRSPHHQRYISERLTPALRDQVLLLKQFMKGIGVYGAELRVHGFSGYLCELLILHVGSFEALVREAAGWRRGRVLDLGGHYHSEEEARRIFEGQPLVVVDPVDPARNVAASVSVQAFSTFVRACQDFLRHPSEGFFFPEEVRKLSKRELEKILRERGTDTYLVIFKLPDLVPDVLYPQLRRTERALTGSLTDVGHRIVRSDVWGEGIGAILIEVQSLPQGIEVREGPPLEVDAENFIRSYLNSPLKLAGPLIDQEGRMVFELKSRRPAPEQVIRKVLQEKNLLGKQVGEAIQRGYQLLKGPEVIGTLSNEHLSLFLSDYYTKCLPWYRRGYGIKRGSKVKRRG